MAGYWQHRDGRIVKMRSFNIFKTYVGKITAHITLLPVNESYPHIIVVGWDNFKENYRPIKLKVHEGQQRPASQLLEKGVCPSASNTDIAGHQFNQAT